MAMYFISEFNKEVRLIRIDNKCTVFCTISFKGCPVKKKHFTRIRDFPRVPYGSVSISRDEFISLISK